MINKLKQLLVLCLKILYIFPVNNKKIFFMCFDGTMIGFDSKAFVDWINNNKKDEKFKMYWGVKSNKYKKQLFLENVQFIKLKSIRGIYHMMTSGTLIYNINPPSYIPFRKKQLLINTWHGYPVKKIGKYINNFNSKQFNTSTCFLSHSEEYTNLILKDSFEYNGEILKCGTPRNDVFFDKCAIDKNKEKIYTKYSISKNKKVLLYAPTFRGDFVYEKSNLDFQKIKRILEKKFGGEWIILCRLHPMIVSKFKLDIDNVIDVSFYPDMQELLCASDILITDYSSCMWDFSLMKRPVFIYADDKEKYEKMRGFYFNFDELPYELSASIDELEYKILNFNYNDYQSKISNYLKKINCYEAGDCCLNVYNYIKEWQKYEEKFIYE